MLGIAFRLTRPMRGLLMQKQREVFDFLCGLCDFCALAVRNCIFSIIPLPASAVSDAIFLKIGPVLCAKQQILVSKPKNQAVKNRKDHAGLPSSPTGRRCIISGLTVSSRYKQRRPCLTECFTAKLTEPVGLPDHSEITAHYGSGERRDWLAGRKFTADVFPPVPVRVTPECALETMCFHEADFFAEIKE